MLLLSFYLFHANIYHFFVPAIAKELIFRQFYKTHPFLLQLIPQPRGVGEEEGRRRREEGEYFLVSGVRGRGGAVVREYLRDIVFIYSIHDQTTCT